jgi:hypothetical protein
MISVYIFLFCATDLAFSGPAWYLLKTPKEHFLADIDGQNVPINKKGEQVKPVPAADRKPKPKSAQPENQPSDEMEYYEEVIAPQLASVEMDDTNDGKTGKTENNIDTKTGKTTKEKNDVDNIGQSVENDNTEDDSNGVIEDDDTASNNVKKDEHENAGDEHNNEEEEMYYDYKNNVASANYVQVLNKGNIDNNEIVDNKAEHSDDTEDRETEGSGDDTEDGETEGSRDDTEDGETEGNIDDDEDSETEGNNDDTQDSETEGNNDDAEGSGNEADGETDGGDYGILMETHFDEDEYEDAGSGKGDDETYSYE